MLVKRVCKILENATAGSCNIFRKSMDSTFYFMNSYLSGEENCLDKVHFGLIIELDTEMLWILFVRSENLRFL